MTTEAEIRKITPVMEMGDCYEANAVWLMNKLLSKEADSHMLCHGDVVGQGDRVKGVTYGHCWVEFQEDVVFDFTNNQKVVMRKEEYYDIGEIENVIKFTPLEVAKLLSTHGTYGPWSKQKLKILSKTHKTN